ncbi:Selenoprotein SelK/SelG [Phytophthora cactorum]|nr:Selenoprotein SelK/SelG [Phytophthora cactorum]
MTYVSGGDVVAKRSPWRLSIVTDMFWGVINFVGLLYVALVTTIFSVSLVPFHAVGLVLTILYLQLSGPVDCYASQSNIGQGSTSSRGLGGNGRGGPRRMGGVNHRGTINQPSTLSTVRETEAKKADILCCYAVGGGCCG